ncbi:MAG: 50S ribosomal protein L29 [Flavobacteriales bacterium]
MKAADIKNMSDADILEKIKEETAVLVKMKFNHNIAGTENPMLLRAKRRDIARLKTVLNERKNNK